ncbi:uncharacterized protein BDZ99DRAFT_570606 [Mytilinidion resinicola]|uniref:Uncharacterized protein n=1 Tax=Mytilinidion resinicola TaxID=574789 RepID=A0A6A6YPM9_9PEZI|nr:uncharacterized protein BDZ99DRAFT_570606 [Mytilinidion resinicola]KAF2809974.1 hypothetical protein BDZ99DRAFT_570606 [Mytilinidion resinicola]
MQPPRFSSIAVTAYTHNLESSDRVGLSLQNHLESSPGGSYSLVAGQLQKILNRSTNNEELKKRYKIEKSWREDRRWSLLALLDIVKDQAFLKEIRNLLKEWSSNPRLLSLEHDKFQSNICLFVEARTGRKGLQYQENLYEAIEKQRTDIALQQQIITCLEYRYALEHRPQKHAPLMTTLAGTASATGAWQMMWKLAMETELDKTIVDYINPLNPALLPATSTTTASSAASTLATPVAGAVLSCSSTTNPTPLAAPPSFRVLLQLDFSFWAKACVQLRNAKNPPTITGGTAPSTAPGTAPVTAAPPLAKHRKWASPPSWTTTGNFNQTVEVYKPEYWTWPSFRHGYDLYSELSANIHTYNKSYDIHEINFTRNSRLILK